MYLITSLPPRAVDFVANGVPDYLETIKHPMGFKNDSRLAINRKYKNIKEFKDNYKLLINNCSTYNAKNIYVYKDAIKLEKIFNITINNLIVDDPT